MIRWLVSSSILFLVLISSPGFAHQNKDCQANLIGSYQALLDAAYRDGNLTFQDLIKASESAAPVNPLAGKSLHAYQLPLKKAFERLLTGIDEAQWNQVRLHIESNLKTIQKDRASQRDAKTETRMVFNPTVIAKIPVKFANNLTWQAGKKPKLIIQGTKKGRTKSHKTLDVEFQAAPTPEEEGHDFIKFPFTESTESPKLLLDIHSYSGLFGIPRISLETSIERNNKRQFEQEVPGYRSDISCISTNEVIYCTFKSGSGLAIVMTVTPDGKVGYAELGVSTGDLNGIGMILDENRQPVVAASVSDGADHFIEIFKPSKRLSPIERIDIEASNIHWLKIDEEKSFFLVNDLFDDRIGYLTDSASSTSIKVQVPAFLSGWNLVKWITMPDGQVYLAYKIKEEGAIAVIKVYEASDK